MRNVNEAVIHALATKPNWMVGRSNAEKQAEVTRWHVEDNGWRAIGYNFIIWRDGEVTIGRDLDNDGDTFEEVGAHARGHNQNSVGIALEGGYGGAADDLFSTHYTGAQEASLIRTLDLIENKFGDVKITGHNQYARKACPCFSVPAWLAQRETGPRVSPSESKQVRVSATQIVGGVGAVGSAVAGLDGSAQMVAIGFGVVMILLGVWFFRERLQKWSEGVR